MKKFVFLIILLAFSLPTFIHLIRPGYFPMQDDMQAFRIFELDKCIADGQLPCRWVPDAGYGYGYPLFNYYSPLVYYLGESFHLLGFQFIAAVKIIFIIGFLSSALFMYLLVKEFTGPLGAVISSLLFIYFPFRAAEVYVRGALSEFFAISFFPILFLYSYKLIKEEKIKYVIYFALSLAALFLTHNLLSIVFIPFLLIWITYWIFKEKKIMVLKKVAISGLLGFGLAAFFLIPLIFERQYVHLETLLGGYFDYRQHFVSVKQLFLSNTWDYGSSQLGDTDNLALSTGILHWSLAAISLVVYLSGQTVILFLLALVSLFLIHQRSAFFWQTVPFLKWLQFPWRFLAISGFLFSFLSGFIFIKFKKIKYLLGIIIIVLIYIFYGSFFKPFGWFKITDAEKFSGTNWEKQLTISIFDYLPIYAPFPPSKKAPDLPEALSGKIDFLDYTKGSNFQKGSYALEKETKVIFPIYDFPGMKLMVDNKEVSHGHDLCLKECLGLVSANLPAGKHSVTVRLFDTWPRKLGNWLTVLSIVVLIFYKKLCRKRKLF